MGHLLSNDGISNPSGPKRFVTTPEIAPISAPTSDPSSP